MKKLNLLLLAGACLSLNSQAQSLGDLLRSTVTEAARNVVTKNVQQAISGAANQAPAHAAPQPAESSPASGAVTEGAATAQLPAQPGCKRLKGASLLVGQRPDSFEPASLWPENPDCPVARFSDLKFERATAAKHAFREASKIRCKDCEGGYAFDAWGGRSLIKSGDYSKEFPKLLVALGQGESLSWKGNKYTVSITATGSHPVGATPCKQFHYVLKDKNTTVAEYDNMYCQYTGYYAANPSWHEVV